MNFYLIFMKNFIFSGYPHFVKLGKDLKLEKKSIYILLTPLFLIIALWVYIKKKFIHNPKTNFYFFDGVSKNCREIKDNAAGWRALDIIYNYRKGNENPFADFWYDLRSSQGTRNRIKLIKFLLLRNIKEISKNNKEVRLISIASGSAQGIIEVIDEAKRNGIIVKAVLIDLDLIALEHSRKLAQEMKVEDQVIFINKTTSFINKIGREFKPHLIEVVGFLEYRPFNKALELIRSTYQILENEGILLISHIAPNLESFFLKEVINWLMIYRKPKEVAKLLSLADFNLKNCSFYWEPLKIHYTVECKKL